MNSHHTKIQDSDRRLILPYLGLVVTAAIWGFIPVFQKQLMESLSPIQLTFSRFFLTGVLVGLWTALREGWGLSSMIKEDLGKLILTTLLGPLSALLLLNYGIQTLPIGVASCIIACEPLLTYFFAVLCGQEGWNKKRLASILGALLGLFMVISADGQSKNFWFGLLTVGLSTTIWAINTILSKDLVAKYSPFAMMGFNFLLGSLFLIPFLGDNYFGAMLYLSTSQWFALLFSVIPGTVVGFSIWYTCLKYVSPSTVSLSLYLVPVVSVIGGVFWFNESLRISKFVGVVLVLLCVYLVSVKYRNERK
jgi:drug/metabolite transporter (DMT)-like permease